MSGPHTDRSEHQRARRRNRRIAKEALGEFASGLSKFALRAAGLIVGLTAASLLFLVVAHTACVTVVNATTAPTGGGYVEVNGQRRPVRPLPPGGSQSFIFNHFGGENSYRVVVRLASGRMVDAGGEGYLALGDMFVYRTHRITS